MLIYSKLHSESCELVIKLRVLKKDVFRLVTSVGQRKNSESPWGIESHTFEFRAPMLAPCRQIRSIIILVKNRANSRCAVVGFCKHSYCWKYRHSKWFVINRNGLIVFWRTVFLSREITKSKKVQMDKSPLVKWNIQTKNAFYNSETVQPPLLNWFNKNTINWSVNWSGSMSK